MSQMPRFRLGLGSRAFPWATGHARGPRPKHRLDPLEFIEIARELGMDLIQITDDMLLEYLPWEALIRLKRYAGANGMRMVVGTRGLDIDQCMKFLEIAVFVKSPTLLIRPYISGKAIPSIGNIREVLHILLPEFEKESVQLLLENQEPYDVRQYKDLLEEMNHPLLGMSLDPGLSLKSGGNPDRLVETLGPWCLNLYFRDWKKPQPALHETASGCIAGQGDLSLVNILTSLDQKGRMVDVIVGLETPWQDSLSDTLKLEKRWVKESLAYLRELS